jgi:hypothetical protein
MIFQIFSPKNGEKWGFWLETKLPKLFKNLIITLVFEKNANCFAQNRRKLWS